MGVLASLFAAALVVAIPTSRAGSVGVSVSSQSDVTFVAGFGERNAVEVNYPSPTLVVSDLGAQLTAGAGCVSLGPNSAQCETRPHVDAYLGDKDDTARVAWSGIVRVWGGSGNDRFLADGFGDAFGYGEGGDDIVDVVADGVRLADGGPGDDVVRLFSYGGESTGIGGGGRDIIEYRNATGMVVGPVTLDGGSGDDTILAQPTFRGQNTATGGSGNDVIVVTEVAPFFETGSSYLLTGGPGADALTGGDSIDTVDGGAGDDSIDVRGGGADTVTCGAGIDLVLYDASDTVSGDCETTLLS
jgi:Ca2+-binding RTX toxin-like protein